MRVAENLNLALGDLLDGDPRVYLLGEDIVDPYGGAFKVTKGLSTRHPERVIPTPLSEGGLVGVGGGLALAGEAAVLEIMFGDFVALAFDQIANFASKSVSMYGRRVPMRMVVRCPTGGGRGYGPTHSQSLQKHFIGLPGLSVHEVSPFHDNRELLPELLGRGEPAMLFEDKVLYTERMFTDGVVDDLFSYDMELPGVARVFADTPDTYDCVLIVPGGLTHRALAAARSLLLEHEIACLLLVPSQLYPFDTDPLLPVLRRAELVCVAEEGTAGGTWGSEVAQAVHRTMWSDLRRPVSLVHSQDSVIPTAAHLENEVLVSADTISAAVTKALHG
ncbi:transketolase C-terminal domain-containing protein [Nocardiopsis deserti]|uniref:transketolase C-terminal domain-containing protein n=1 Tax=Nocardiopsis deserti TaxID=2605988 RepID=UPI00123C6ED0|nr:transketolase C-terminal domain-containing protein [Nocardiopsis deserti]